jgi:aryl-alcohol dehydrogenase-like predicted oxidoreductase
MQATSIRARTQVFLVLTAVWTLGLESHPKPDEVTGGAAAASEVASMSCSTNSQEVGLHENICTDNEGSFSLVRRRSRPLPEHAYTTLSNGARVCRLVNGLWQLSGKHAYRPDRDMAIADMRALVTAGFTTFDLADHYGEAEDFIGDFLQERWEDAQRTLMMQGHFPINEPRGNTTSSDLLMEMTAHEHGEPLTFHTKWAPQPGPMPLEAVRFALDTARYRMAVSTLDLVAFHWWDYSDLRYRHLLLHATSLVLQRPPVLNGVALTNFDLNHLQEIVEPRSSAKRTSGFEGVPIVSNQVSFSIVDSRPLEGGMLQWCEQRGITIMAYGVLLGGLLSDAWLGANEPAPRSKGGDPSLQLDTASLEKYFGFILRWGSWKHFQDLLAVLRSIADKHEVLIRSNLDHALPGKEALGAGGAEASLWQHSNQHAAVSIAHVAIRWVLQQSSKTASPSSICAIVGSRVGHPWGMSAKYARENSVVFAFELDAQDLDGIDAARTAEGTRPLLDSMGDCGDEYRRQPGNSE